MKSPRRLLTLGGGSLLLLVLILIIAGFILPPQWRVRVEQTSPHSARQLYPFISNFHAWEHWVGMDADAHQARQLTIEGKAATTGHSYRWTAPSSRGTLTITRVEENKGIWYEGAIESDETNASGSITLAPIAAGGTLIVWQDQGSLPSGTGLFAILMTQSMRAKLAEDLHRLHDIELGTDNRASKPSLEEEQPSQPPSPP